MRALCCAWLILLAQVATALAAPAASREPLTVKSETLKTDNNSKSATFEGKVVARQGDMTIYADRLVVYSAGEGNELSRVEAFGNVRILQGDRQATGARALYDPKAAKIVLDGSPRALQGEDVITGKVITYYLNEKRSVVTGGLKEPVEAVIHPGGKSVGAKP